MTRYATLALCLFVAACNDDPKPSADQSGAAAGEVLAGSISDAMIPLDQLESQAPLAPRQAPAAGDVDAEQPEVTPVAGIDRPVTAETEAASAAPVSPSASAPVPAG